MKIIIILCSLLGIILVMLSYYNFFKKIEVKLKSHESICMVYKSVLGDYKQGGKISDEIYWDLLNNFKVETFRGIGLYFDNPKEKEISELRSDIGCILENAEIPNLNEIKSKYEFKEIPENIYPTVEFPYKGKLSVMFGLFKVYPELIKYMNNNEKFKDSYIIEIWDIPNKKIIYRISTK